MGDFDADIFLGFGRAGSEVRGENNVRKIAQREVRWRRLDFKHVECGGTDLAGLQSFTECGFIDESPTGAIHNANAFFANSQSAGVEHVAGLIGEWHVHAYEIGLRKERVDVFDEFHLHATSAAYREVGIVGQYTHAKGHGAAGEFGADASHA